jgi:hypothetical protein
MAALSIGKAWEESVAFVKREGQLLFPVALLFLAVPFAILFQMMPAEYLAMTPGQTKIPPLPSTVKLGMMVTAIITLAGSLTLYALALKPGISVGEAIRLGVQRLPVLIGAALIAAMGYLMGVVLLSLFAGLLSVVIGAPAAVTLATIVLVPLLIYIIARLILLNAVVIDRNDGLIASLRAAWMLTAGHVWRLIAFIIVLILISSVIQMAVQAVFGVIGGLAGGPEAARATGDFAVAATSAVIQIYFQVMTARIYRQLNG